MLRLYTPLFMRLPCNALSISVFSGKGGTGYLVWLQAHALELLRALLLLLLVPLTLGASRVCALRPCLPQSAANNYLGACSLE